MRSPSDCEILSPCPEVIISAQASKQPVMDVNSAASPASECVTDPTELQFQANAVAALLELQRLYSITKEPS